MQPRRWGWNGVFRRPGNLRMVVKPSKIPGCAIHWEIHLVKIGVDNTICIVLISGFSESARARSTACSHLVPYEIIWEFAGVPTSRTTVCGRTFYGAGRISKALFRKDPQGSKLGLEGHRRRH